MGRFTAINKKNLIPLLLISLLLNACQYEGSDMHIPLIPYQVVKTMPHDQQAFTQGLVIHDGKLLEGTGSSNSWIAEVDLATGRQQKRVQLEERYFGEGITVLNNKLYQLTWTDNIGFIYDLSSFKQVGAFSYATEGWGLTTDGKHLVISDGTDKIYYLDTLSFKKVKTLSVKEKGRKVKKINELEWVNGFIYANQWRTNYLLKIDPVSGRVIGKVDLSALADEARKLYAGVDVLNGIAFYPATGEFLVTGKYWPQAYWIRLEQ